MSYLTRTLADGSVRFVVGYRDADGRKIRRILRTREAAEALKATIAAASRRWPIQPLIDLCGMTPIEWAKAHTGRHSIRGEYLQGLTTNQADRLAMRAGFHPVEVWGWAWVESGEALTAIDQDAAA